MISECRFSNVPLFPFLDDFDSSSELQSYIAATCPNREGDKHSGSGDRNRQQNNNEDMSYTSNSYARYGSIKGYGYGTKKCVCYTNGSGCDCSNQNEGYAIRNLATYGPAVVCLDASTWQDYSSGIITSDSGCGSGFMDVNHCVQAVGYAFFEDGDDASGGGGGGSHDNNNRNSHSGDNQQGSRDSGQRSGYWIIKNQWSTYWGMNGYAYVAMGENTCGVLNDMVQVYT
jgi:Papain family cysteine protease